MQPTPSDPPSSTDRQNLPVEMPPPTPSSKSRRRGGQQGNTNRLVHGLYSRRLPRELAALQNPRSTLDPDFEIGLARVHLARLLDAQKAAPEKDWLAYERAIMNYLGLIISLINSAARRKRRDPELFRILRSLRHARELLPDLHPDDSNLIRTSDSDLGIYP
ncbi:MAG TPA: hypothetical protein VIU38_02065 [Anaerolineales bacterium]